MYVQYIPLPAPKRKSADYKKLLKFCNKVEIILQVVNDNEYQAAITMLKPPNENFDKAVVFPSNGKVIGMFADLKTAIIQTDVGSNASTYIEDGLNQFPYTRFIIGVGVGYSFDGSKYKFGDVLVSKKISDLKNLKFDAKGDIVDRGQTINVVKPITSIFCQDVMFYEDFEVSKTGRTAKVYCGRLCSYTALLDNKEMRDKFYHAVTEAIGGEMEGGQLLEFQQRNKVEGIVVVKGVVDYADGNKSKGWQFTAALAALRYVKSKLYYYESVVESDDDDDDLGKEPNNLYGTDEGSKVVNFTNLK